MNREELKKLMPHREPMLLVDEAEAIQPDEAIGKYLVKGDEWFLQGHFPGNPVVPGVCLCEIMAQTCCVLLAEDEVGSTPVFTHLNKAKILRMVKPGDELEIHCKIVKKRANFRFAEGKALVDGKVAAQAEFTFALIKQEQNGSKEE